MYVVIYGLGYVGLTAAACLTKARHKVLGVDVSDEKIAAVNRGVSPSPSRESRRPLPRHAARAC
jgi:GDP-mannose 6-dehydrogenase